MQKFVLISLCALALTACASKNKAEKIDTKVDLPAPVSTDSVIGVKDGNLVYQRKAMMNEELRHLETTVYDLEARVYGGPRYLDNRGLYGMLKDCRAEMSEYKNGGDGKLLWTEKRDYVTPDDDYTNIGIENKRDIVGVSEEYLSDRLARFKNYKKALIDRQEEFETKVKVCKLALSAQRGERVPASAQ